MPRTSTPARPAPLVPPSEVTFPVADTGHGEDTATIRIDSGQLTQRHVLEVVRALGHSKTPVTVIFATKTPTPQFVTLQEAAETLSVSMDHVKRLAKAGWIQPVHWLTEVGEDAKKVATSVEVAEATGDYTGWHLRIPWSDVERLTRYGYEHGHLPSVRSPGPNGRSDFKHWKDGSVRELSIAAVAHRIVREAVDDDGTQQWLTQAEIHRRTLAEVEKLRPGQKVNRRTIQTAIVLEGVRRKKVIERAESGVVRRRGGRLPDDARPGFNVFRWVGSGSNHNFELPDELDYQANYQFQTGPAPEEES